MHACSLKELVCAAYTHFSFEPTVPRRRPPEGKPVSLRNLSSGIVRLFVFPSTSFIMLSMQSTFGCEAPLCLPGFRRLSRTNGCRASFGFSVRKWDGFERKTRQIFIPISCSATGDGETSDVSTVRESSAADEGSMKNNGSHPAKAFASNELLEKLKRYGISGVLSYGLLNTVYYLSTFILVWFYVAPVPGRMGYIAAAKRFLKVTAMVWAGSQLTKIPRAGGALALAPLVDSGLSWFTEKFKFESRRKAFLFIVGSCLGLAFLLFLVITMLWA